MAKKLQLHGSFPSKAGEPGGYYVPQVDQSGAGMLEFSFTPSKEGMPAIPPVGFPVSGTMTATVEFNANGEVSNISIPASEIHKGIEAGYNIVLIGTVYDEQRVYGLVSMSEDNCEFTYASGSCFDTIIVQRNGLIGREQGVITSAPEIHISSEPPTNGEAIWINPDEEPEDGGAVSTEAIKQAVNEYMAEHPEADPTVPDWAKQPEKPKYTAAEVGALPADTPIPEGVTDEQIQNAVDAYLTENPPEVSGGGEKKWELFGSITLTEDVSDYIIGDMTNNANSFVTKEYTELLILCSLEGHTSVTSKTHVNIQANTYAGGRSQPFTNFIPASGASSSWVVHAKMMAGGEIRISVGDRGQYATATTTKWQILSDNMRAMSFIRYFRFAAAKFGAGSTIKIYGR